MYLILSCANAIERDSYLYYDIGPTYFSCFTGHISCREIDLRVLNMLVCKSASATLITIFKRQTPTVWSRAPL